MPTTLSPTEDGAVALSLHPEPRAPHTAREALENLGVVPGDRLMEIQLLVTELVTNSVVHAGLRPGERIEVSIQRSDTGVRVEVADQGPGFDPPPPPEDPFATSGRGLALVNTLSDRWGVETDGLTRVWFEIDLNRP